MTFLFVGFPEQTAIEKQPDSLAMKRVEETLARFWFSFVFVPIFVEQAIEKQPGSLAMKQVEETLARFRSLLVLVCFNDFCARAHLSIYSFLCHSAVQ